MQPPKLFYSETADNVIFSNVRGGNSPLADTHAWKATERMLLNLLACY